MIPVDAGRTIFDLRSPKRVPRCGAGGDFSIDLAANASHCSTEIDLENLNHRNYKRRKHHSPQFPLLSSKSNSFLTESTESTRSLFSASLIFDFVCSEFFLCDGNSFFLKPKEIAVPLVSTVEERFLLSV